MKRLEKAFVCPSCRCGLSKDIGAFICQACNSRFRLQDRKIFFSTTDASSSDANDDLVFRLKNYLKIHNPGLFFFLYRIAAVFVGKSASEVSREQPPDALMINIGSGAKRIQNVFNVDIAAEQDVDVIASAYELPFANESLDLIIAESLLEHLEYPEKAMTEMYRILKKGGRIYIVTPFILGFHSSPNDFYRWTIPGMKILLKDFLIEEADVAIGPTSGVTAILREWLAIALSFNSKLLYQCWVLVFTALFIPVNWLDYLFGRYGTASQIALAYYWIGKKQ